MRSIEYENFCRDVGHKVKNLEKNLVGEVLNCNRGYFNVRVGEGWQVWSKEECEDADTGHPRREPEYII